MKGLDEREFGLERLNDYELSVSGGITFKQVVDFVEKFFFYAEQAEKYWPSFRDGFKRGWEAA